MNTMYVVRKQLYIDERQERALKRRAKSLGVTQAELVRRALGLLLGDRGALLVRLPPALQAFLRRARRVAARHTLESPRVVREDLYAEREDRWRRPR